MNSDGPHSVNAGITVTTSGETVNEGICVVLGIIQEFLQGVQPGDIDGVQNVTYVRHDVEGDLCVAPVETILSPINELVMDTPKKSNWNSIIWPPFAALYVAAALFIARRRRSAGEKELEADPDDVEEEIVQRRGLFGIDGYEEEMHYRGGGKPDHLNSLDVHQCSSLQCKICAQSIAPAFLPVTRSDSLLLRQINETSTLSENDIPRCQPVTDRKKTDQIFKFEDSSKADTLDNVSLT